MNAPADIQAIKDKPGVYFVSTRLMLVMGYYGAIEVDEDGLIHQLTPEGERDGVLDDEGWNPDIIVVGKKQAEGRTRV